MFRIDDKVVVIFGGNGYLGRQFAGALLSYGGIVHICDIDASERDDIKALKREYGGRLYLHEVDATEKGEVHALRDALIERCGHVDVLINTTTMKGSDFYLPFEEVSREGWEVGLKGNLTIPFLTCQAFIPQMAGRRSGSVINIASHYGLVGNDQRIYEGSNLHKVYAKEHPEITQVYSHGVYNAAKGGLINFTRYLAAYYGKDNVRANCISPGGISQSQENETFVRKYGEKTPLGRKARPDEINGAVVFLASDASSYVTGHNLVVDGGFTIW